MIVTRSDATSTFLSPSTFQRVCIDFGSYSPSSSPDESGKSMGGRRMPANRQRADRVHDAPGAKGHEVGSGGYLQRSVVMQL